ncbi:MAG: hypothetical protein KAQ62_00490 [Cyclobacteriaceae bacterium]|nr:hypothetical protein [Cyclobacteriaceae bacterium]MCK5366988.1 hypothetical protein [Cyclobacteriaceae bacterium]
MSDINFIITQKEDLKSLIYQWLDEHPHFLFQAGEKEKDSDKPMSRSELAKYLGISKVTVDLITYHKFLTPYYEIIM